MDRDGQQLAIRRVVLEYGAMPVSWLQHIDSTAALSQAVVDMRKEGEIDGNRCLIDIPKLARCLDVPEQHSKILVDILDAVMEPHNPLVRRTASRSEADAADVHAVALFLFSQLYIRQAQRPEAMEVWPSPSSQPVSQPMSTVLGSPLGSEAAAAFFAGPLPGVHLERTPPPINASPSSAPPGASPPSASHHENHAPASPARSNSSTSSQGSERKPYHAGVQFQQQKSNQLVRRELQAHLKEHAALLHGYTDHIRRHTHALLSLLLNKPMLGVQEGSFQGHGGSITAGEFDRLSFLMHSASDSPNPLADGSPMDTSPTPFSEDGGRLSLGVPLFMDSSENCEAPLTAVADWLAANIYDEVYPADSMLGSPNRSHPGALPPAGIVQDFDLGGSVDIQGVCKSTVVRGEDDFPNGSLRITDCHDTIIYALAHLQYASLICCSDCTVVLGAVSRMLRVERCERLTLIAASIRICISSCHESTFYLGVNRQPLLIGDNRVLQMAPYNTQYERLPVHLQAAGVDPSYNLWDQAVTLARHHKPAVSESLSTAASPGGTAQSRPTVQMLPPDKLLPFMIPFQGGSGPLCGGAASGGVTRLAADLGSFVGLGDPLSSVGGSGPSTPPTPPPPLPSSPFTLPPAYQESKERKVHAVTELRQHIKSATLDEARKRELQAVIQAYFKEWLHSTGKLREVYDLARMEREDGNAPQSPRQ